VEKEFADEKKLTFMFDFMNEYY